MGQPFWADVLGDHELMRKIPTTELSKKRVIVSKPSINFFMFFSAMSSDLDCTQLLEELASQLHVRISLRFVFKI